MTKTEVREKFKEKRSELSAIEIEQKSIAIANQTLKLDIWHHTYFHLFLTIAKQKEVNTEMLMHVLQGKDKQILVSRSNFKDHSLKHFLLTDSTPIIENKYGIPEPKEGIEVPVDKIEVVFVPLLALDHKGHRVGYGKGFYDRFLNSCRDDTVKIGLSFFEAIESSLEVDSYDIPLNYAVSPQKVYKF